MNGTNNRTAFLLAIWLTGVVSLPSLADEVDKVATPATFILGTQTFGVRYQFTEKTRLVETAEAIHEMGSDIFKGFLGQDPEKYAMPVNPKFETFKDLASLEPSYRKVLAMPFKHYFLWVMSGEWHDGMSESEQKEEYDEIYELGCYLLTEFDGTGKTFYLGHWEGDWTLMDWPYQVDRDPTPVQIAGMIQWLKVRQKAIEAASHDVRSSVKLYHYAEVNLVQKAMKGGKGFVNDVLPHVNVDYVSYSCYDTIYPHKGDVSAALHAALDYIESKLPPKPSIKGKRVFIGEYGFPVDRGTTPKEQDIFSRDVCGASLEWGCPFVLYWEMYCNENKNGKHRGFWLIDDKNQKQPFYFTLQSYYERSRRFVAEFQKRMGRSPTDAEYRKQAIRILEQIDDESDRNEG